MEDTGTIGVDSTNIISGTEAAANYGGTDELQIAAATTSKKATVIMDANATSTEVAVVPKEADGSTFQTFLATASLSEPVITLISTESNEIACTLDTGDSVTCIALSHDSQLVAYGNCYGEVKIWNVSKQAIQCLRSSSDEMLLAILALTISAGDNHLAAKRRNSIVVWEIPCGIRLFKVRCRAGFYTTPAMYFSCEDTLVTSYADETADTDNRIVFWELKLEGATWRIQCENLTDFSFCDDTNTLAYTCNNRTVTLYNCVTAEKLLLTGHVDNVICCKFCEFGDLIATGSADHTVRVWNVNDGSLAASILLPNHVVSVAWCPKASRLACGVSSGDTPGGDTPGGDALGGDTLGGVYVVNWRGDIIEKVYETADQRIICYSKPASAILL
jgi:WD40 repeat protein